MYPSKAVIFSLQFSPHNVNIDVRFILKFRGHACIHAKLLQLCLTLCNPMDYNLPGSSVHGILQARILEWVAMPSSRGSSRPRDWTCESCVAGRFFTAETKVMKKQIIIKITYSLLDPVPGLLLIHFPTVWIRIWPPKKEKKRKEQEEHFRMRETSDPKEIQNSTVTAGYSPRT